jgi:predicted nucleic-acid-binding protein
MTAVDTNVLIRVLTGDDPRQDLAARTLLASGPIWIAKTVLLETAWVLRSLYHLDDSAIRTALVKLLGLRNVQAEDGQAVATALRLAAHGIDFADALHLCSRPASARFASFDRTLVRRAKRAGLAGVTGID